MPPYVLSLAHTRIIFHCQCEHFLTLCVNESCGQNMPMILPQGMALTMPLTSQVDGRGERSPLRTNLCLSNEPAILASISPAERTWRSWAKAPLSIQHPGPPLNVRTPPETVPSPSSRHPTQGLCGSILWHTEVCFSVLDSWWFCFSYCELFQLLWAWCAGMSLLGLSDLRSAVVGL